MPARIIFALFIALLFSPQVFSQPMGGDVLNPPDEIRMRNRWGVMPAVVFVKNHPDYTSDSKPGRGLGLSWRGELMFKRGEKLKLMMGCDYMMQFMSFNSYYNPVIYDKNFKYQHRLIIHQLMVPLLFKYCFGNEDNQINIPYISGGWSFRALMGSGTRITDNETGEVVFKGFTDLSLEHSFLFDAGGGVLMAGAGFEHKVSTDYKKAVYLEFYYRHNLSRVSYTGNNFSNKGILFRDPALTICVGYEF